MRWGSKTLAAVVALLLLAGLAGCGGGDGSDSTAAQAGGGSGESTAKDATAKQGGAEGKSGSSAERQPDPGDASEFKPRHHTDSGGGAEQFKVKGGDNSIQEFGEEADTSDFEAAATALHDFLDARAEGNWAAVCRYLSKSTVESLERLASRSKQGGDTSCSAILAAITNPAAGGAVKAEAEKADVGSLRTDGDQAFLIYTGAEKGTILAMPMADEAGTWKVASLAGTPLN
ncbi:MAG TPA: hypothetical protein VF085_01110 [Solirubrobacterales bacterium]